MRTGNRGSALLTVLWLTAALSAIGVAVAANVRGETERAGTNVDDAKSFFLASGGIQRAALRMIWGKPFYDYLRPTMELDFPAGVVHIDIIPETSKLGLNGARPQDLARLMMVLGVPEDKAVEIASGIVDWRTPDPLHQSPYDGYYLGLSPSFQQPHTSFRENEELLLVKGMTPDLYFGTSLDERAHPGLRDCVSIYGSPGSTDANTARPEVMEALGLTAEDANAIVKLREAQGAITPQQLNGIRESLGPVGQRLGLGGLTIFTLRATARLRQPDGKLSDMRRTVSAQIRFPFNGARPNNASGIEILRWYDRGL